MKKCSKCGVEKKREEFNKNKANRDGLACWCKECRKKYYFKNLGYLRRKARINYYNNYKEKREKQNTYAKLHRKDKKKYDDGLRTKKRLLVFNYLCQTKCVDCGNNNPLVLEFDHVLGKKTKAIATLMGDGSSIVLMEDEIKKCEIVCSNCHSIRTQSRMRSFRHKYFNERGE